MSYVLLVSTAYQSSHMTCPHEVQVPGRFLPLVTPRVNGRAHDVGQIGGATLVLELHIYP